MRIENKKNKANYVNFKDEGNPRKILIAAGRTVDIPRLKYMSQIINLGDFNRGFFEVASEIEVVTQEVKALATKKTKRKKKSEDSFSKIEKEVKDYTDNKE